MKVDAYVKIKRDRGTYGAVGNLSISKSKPDVQANEVVTLLHFDIPDELFEKPPLEAHIVVKPPSPSSVPTLTIEAGGVLVDWINKKT